MASNPITRRVNPTLPCEGVTQVNYENQEEVVAFTDFAGWIGYF